MYPKLHTYSTVSHRPDLDQQLAGVYAILVLLQDACSDKQQAVTLVVALRLPSLLARCAASGLL